jgi:hypothetical protein
MYLINQTTKDQILDCLFQSNLIIASIPETIINDKMKDLIANALHESQLKINLLHNLKEVEDYDLREFHQMD